MIQINLQSPTPVVEQIIEEIRRAIAQGELRPKDPLPPVRQLAGDLGVHWNTVARAYRDLATMGFLTVVRGRRAIVRSAQEWRAQDPEVARAAVIERFQAAMTEARLAGISKKEIRDIFERQLSSWYDQSNNESDSISQDVHRWTKE